MRDAYEIGEYLQYLLHDSTESMWDEATRLTAINAAYDQICNRIIQAYENWFYTETTLTPGTSSWEKTPFELPNPKTVVKILLVTDTDGRPIEPINLAMRDYSYPTVANRNVDMGYWLGHDTLYVNAKDYTDNLRLYYIRRPCRLLTGTASAGSTSSITFATSPAPDGVDDYYNGSYLWIKSGTGAGQRVEITDYVGSTRVASATFSTAPDTTSAYALESELPDGHNEIVAYGAAIRALQFDTRQQGKLEQLKQWYTKLEYDLIDYVKNRQVQTSRSVFMRNLD